MSHEAQRAFFARTKTKYPFLFTGELRVLDCGSLNVNGSLREFFEGDINYVGIDIRSGPGVDRVSLTHEFNPVVPFDVVVSAEMLEHDAYWQQSLRQMYGLLKPGGLMAFSCAAPGRAEHGTVACPDVAPGFEEGLWGTAPEYYRPLSEQDIHATFSLPDRFTQWWMETERRHYDLYFNGLKRG